jgi:hypothetical protein
LYSVANELRSAVVVPGTPSASDAPGAPAVDPLIAEGQAGAETGADGGAAVGAV